MFKKRTIIIGLILLLAIGVLASLGWAELKRAEKKGKEIQQEGTLSTESKIEEKVDAGKMLEEIREDYERKMAILDETVAEKAKPIKEKMKSLWLKTQEMLKSGNEAEYERLNKEYHKAHGELYQLYHWHDEQKRLLEQEKERKEKEIAEKYLEPYVMKEILFIPWGSGKGEAALLDNGIWIGASEEVLRYGPSLKVDKEGNIYIWNEEWDKPESYEKVIKMINNPYIHKYGKIKVKKGNAYEEEYKYLASFSLDEVKKKPLLIEKFSSDYRYKFYRDKDGKAIVEIEDSSGKLQGRIERKEYSGYPFAIDAKGNVYMLSDKSVIQSLGPNEWDLKIYKYNKEGRLLAIIELEKKVDYLYRLDGQKDRIELDKEGNIYQLVGKEDGVHILKWEVK